MSSAQEIDAAAHREQIRDKYRDVALQFADIANG